MKRSKANLLLRRIAPELDAYIGRDRIAFDSHSWAGISFILAQGIAVYHGTIIKDYRPSIGGAKSDLDEEMKNYGCGSWLRPILRRTKPEVLEAACWLSWRYYKAANGESHN